MWETNDLWYFVLKKSLMSKISTMFPSYIIPHIGNQVFIDSTEV